MADTSVKMVIAGDEKDGLRALAALEKKYDKLEGRMRGVTRQSKLKHSGGETLLQQQVADVDAAKGLDGIKGVLERIDKKMDNNRPRPNRNANGE
jgi:hypothetical protein